MTLKELIDTLMISRYIRISINDISGILNNDVLELPFSYQIHSYSFCSVAKSNDEGYVFCTNHKNRINHLCVKSKRCFIGECPYGISEIVYPVIYAGKVICVIYISNMCVNKQETLKKIENTTNITGVPKEKLEFLLKYCEYVTPSLHLKTAEIISEFIINNLSATSEIEDLHFAVSFAKRYLQKYYMHDIHISQIADICHINEKYLGRLFKEQIGVSFRQYLIKVRTSKATELLTHTNKNITDISFMCGFNEITYFNHIFKQKYGLSPSAYREANKKLP